MKTLTEGIHRYNPRYLPRPCSVTNRSTDSAHVHAEPLNIKINRKYSYMLTHMLTHNQPLS